MASNAGLEAFIDTNILVYACSNDEPEKRTIAQAVLARGFHQLCFAVSTQVLLEFYATVTRKLSPPLSHHDARRFLSSLTAWPIVTTTSDLVLSALDLAAHYRISSWDGTIVAASLAAECPLLLTEDLNAGQNYGGTTAINPFVDLHNQEQLLWLQPW